MPILTSPFIVLTSLFYLGLVRAFYFRKQFLIRLLRIEFIMLILFIRTILRIRIFGKPTSSAFYLLIIGACEASLGLRLLVGLIRLGGGDILSLKTGIKC